MKIQELEDTLIEKGFSETKLDTGINYSKKINNIELVCYIEPEIEIQFSTTYKWNDNEIKGAYDISITELNYGGHSPSSLFMSTLNKMPHYVGETNISMIIRNIIRDTFNL